MNILLEIIFWTSVGLATYVYVGYPILVFLAGRLFPRPVAPNKFEPLVSVIITAYNERKDIRKKLRNTLELEYPKEKLQIIVVSDCSSDGTDEIVREFSDEGVELIRQNERRGKTAAQNLAVTATSGEIILFSDATSMYEPNVLKELLPNFGDKSIGCVAGRLTYIDRSDSSLGDGAKKYWNYETFLKTNESLTCSLIGVSGCIYAVRRNAYVPMYDEACSDFLICTLIHKQGLRTVYHPDAVCYEETNTRSSQEFRMRVRVISQTFTDLWRNRDMLNPAKAGFYAVQLISHKVLRYAIPLFLALTLVTSGILATSSIFYLTIFALQLLFYFVAVLDWALQWSGIDIKLLAIPRYFCLANLASAAGFYQFIRGNRFAHWEPIRDVNVDANPIEGPVVLR
ncbi:MAG: glycosyltransferase family 2 protein [Pyrinomonadaceae bacterium]